MRHLIVNADDFGYSFSVNKGIIEAHLKGIVTSTSVLVDAIAAQEAIGLVTYKGLSVGLHFEVQDFEQVEQELERQITKFIAMVGKRPDHIDTHKLHTSHEALRGALLAYAKRYHVPIRELTGIKFIESFMGFRSEGDVSVRRLKAAIDEVTDDCNELMCHVGYSDDYLRTKSSYNDKREEELTSICNSEIKAYLQEKGIELINWTQLPAEILL